MSRVHYLSIALCLILASVLVIYISVKRKKDKRRLRIGLQAIIDVRNLMVLVQQHRGWSTVYTLGDTKAQEQLRLLKNDIQRQNTALSKAYHLTQYDRWQAYVEHWQRLSEKALHLSSSDNFKQHTQLLGCVLFLLEDVAHTYYLTNKEALPDKLLWRDLLQLSEFIGQARALGTAMATIKQFNRVERSKLIALRHQITDLSENLYQRLSEQNLSEDLAKNVTYASKCTRYLCSAIEHELVETKDIDMDRDSYFQLASDSISAINQLFDQELKRIELTM